MFKVVTDAILINTLNCRISVVKLVHLLQRVSHCNNFLMEWPPVIVINFLWSPLVVGAAPLQTMAQLHWLQLMTGTAEKIKEENMTNLLGKRKANVSASHWSQHPCIAITKRH